MRRWLRLFARGPLENTDIHLDVLVDESDRLVSGIPFCGWWGKYKSTDVLPIILQYDGKVDFGSDPEDDQLERFGWCDLHTTNVRSGCQFSFSNGERVDTMVIDKLNDLTLV